MEHQTTNRGLLIDPDRWIQIMMSHVLGARWLCHWPHADLWVTEPCHEGRGVGQALRPAGGLWKESVTYMSPGCYQEVIKKKKKKRKEICISEVGTNLLLRGCLEKCIHSKVLKPTFSLGGNTESSSWLLWALSVTRSCLGTSFRWGRLQGRNKSRDFDESFSMTSSFIHHLCPGGKFQNPP